MRTIRCLFFLLLLQSTIGTFGQIIAPSKNEMYIYNTVVDTLIYRVKAKEGDVKIVLTGEEFILKMLPDTMINIPLFKERPYKGRKKYEGAIWIKIDELGVYENYVSVFTTVTRQIHKRWVAWELEKQISSYTFIFNHDEIINSYKLAEIQCGFFIR
jgi:hypothetical protein